VKAVNALRLYNGKAALLRKLPQLSIDKFREFVLKGHQEGARIAALFGMSLSKGKAKLVAVLALADEGELLAASAEVDESYKALTLECPEAHWFERELWERTGVVPEGHPWLKPIRFIRGGVGLTDFYRVEGEEVHEVAVGPVHAGVIEPGHFRFQCHGERVMHLEISLGYQHRGIERALQGGPDKRTIHYMETLAGDTTIGHATAYAMAVEALGGGQPSARAEALRGIALELERLANHTGDLGALAGDVGYLPTSSYCGRLRGDFLNLTALVCGNRFGRGMIRPGGMAFDMDDDRARRMSERLEAALRDTAGAVNLLWDTPSVMDRFEGTGILPRETCEALGLVGPAARACGLERDVRYDHPFGIYRFAHIPVSTWSTGDVYARAQVRWLEIQRSGAFILSQLKSMPEGKITTPVGPLESDSLAVSLVEGWRGEICHVAMTDPKGRFAAYRVFDPSFHNWIGLGMVLRGQEISDFPLCNKSFNLSYCGHDL
jgi:Ni,Fe-hydrogenase III large subunit